MIRRPILDDLAAFGCVARHGSFTRAAAELDMSVSNLSHTVRRLETRLGSRLLQRTSRSVSPTEAGEALLATLQPAFASIDAALDLLDHGRGQVTGTLRLTMTREAFEMVARPVLPAFTAAHPGATIEIQIDYGFRDIVADRFDAGIRLGEKLQHDMIARRVGPELRMAVVAAPAYLMAHGTPEHPRDLLRHRCINYRMVAAGTLYAWEFERDGQALDIRLPGPLVFNEPAPMLQCALDGIGIAYLLERQVAAHLADGSLVRLLPDWTPPFAGFHIYYSSRQQLRPVLAAFLDLVCSRSRRSGA